MSKKDKDVIGKWLNLYNQLFDRNYRVVAWPDETSPVKDIDALCKDDDGGELAIEHTGIEAFEGEKADGARFLKTLAGLENHPELMQPGYDIDLVQKVGVIPTGVDWAGVQREQLKQLKRVLVTMPVGRREVPIVGKGWELRLKVGKARAVGRGSVRTQRAWPGDPGPELILKAVAEKFRSWLNTAVLGRFCCLKKTPSPELLRASSSRP